MPEELGKIEKPPVEQFTEGRKLYFVPLILSNPGLPLEFTLKYDLYWQQVDSQIANLESKLGPVRHIYHELLPEGGEKGLKSLQDLNLGSLQVIQKRVENGSVLEVTEDNSILTELMDWSRCLSIGLQSQKVYATIFQFYTEAVNKRNEFVTKRIDESLKAQESGIVFMGEGHHVQFPSDIQIFYVAPPALDDLKRWIRDYEAKVQKEEAEKSEKKEPNPPAP